jgi:hypothetical protein
VQTALGSLREGENAGPLKKPIPSRCCRISRQADMTNEDRTFAIRDSLAVRMTWIEAFFVCDWDVCLARFEV